MCKPCRHEEIARQLAEQLCRVYLELANARHLPYELEMEFHRLDGSVGMIPRDVFPSHLWEGSEGSLPQAESDEQAPGNVTPHAKASCASKAAQLEIPIS